MIIGDKVVIQESRDYKYQNRYLGFIGEVKKVWHQTKENLFGVYIYGEKNSDGASGLYWYPACDLYVIKNEEEMKMAMNKTYGLPKDIYGRPTSYVDYARHDVESTMDIFNRMYPNSLKDNIEKVIFNGKATIILWKDGSEKTVVKCCEDDIYDPYVGFCAAITKKVMGTTNADIKRIVDGYLPEDTKEKESETSVLGDVFEKALEGFSNLCKARKESFEKGE